MTLEKRNVFLKAIDVKVAKVPMTCRKSNTSLQAWIFPSKRLLNLRQEQNKIDDVSVDAPLIGGARIFPINIDTI